MLRPYRGGSSSTWIWEVVRASIRVFGKCQVEIEEGDQSVVRTELDLSAKTAGSSRNRVESTHNSGIRGGYY